MSKYLGSYIGKKDDINASAKGVWNIFHHLYRKYIGQWPGLTTMAATGGNADGLTPGNGYTYHTFTSPGNFTISDRYNPTATFEVLVVAGGGGGGDSNPGNGGGGGGAGGIVYHTSWPVPAGPYPVVYPVVVGSGGPGAPVTESSGTTGSDSTFGPPVARLTAKGGGGGGFYTSNGSGGGCGGGGGGAGTSGGTGTQPAQTHPGAPAPGWTNYGNPGGSTGPGNPGDAGSGGGTAAAGNNAGPGGNGQAFPGFEYPIVGLTLVTPLANSPTNNQYGGGGGGEDYSVNPPWISGQGGGGGTKPPTYPPPQTAIPLYAGVNGTGGGGAAASDSPTEGAVASRGGDGVVIIRYQ